MELYIRQLRRWSLEVFYERIVCLTHLVFSSFISSSSVAIAVNYSAAPILSNSGEAAASFAWKTAVS